MKLEVFRNTVRNNPEQIKFSDTMNVIEGHYTFSPTAFKNGSVQNASGENSGSCKLFAFAQKQGLSETETLTCFGEHYKDVLNDPNGTGHQNIRNFIKTGFQGLVFGRNPLEEK